MYGQRPPPTPPDPLRRQIETMTSRVVSAQPIARALVEAKKEGRVTTPTHGGRAVTRMVNLIEGFNAELQAHVEKTMAAAVAPHLERAKQSVTKVGDTVGKAFADAASQAEDYVNQLTNGDPTAT